MPKRFVLISLAAGIITSVVVGIADTYLPYSEPKIRIIDALTLPGALIAGIAYPQGVHTGRGAPLFGLWAMIANLVVYVAFWYLCLRMVWHFKHNSAPRPGGRILR